AVKELVTDANFDCSDEGIKLQAMDNSHVALVSLNLAKSGFTEYRCDRDLSLGMSLASLQKIVKCAGNNDMVTLRADDSLDVLALLFEAKRADRVGEYEMKLMDIDADHLGIPDTVYDAEISLSSAEFARIIRDLKELGESVKIEVSKEGVRFSADGDIGSASKTAAGSGKKGGKKADGEKEDEGVKINLQQAVALTFSIKYLSNFAKSTPLAERVRLHMSNEVPLLVEYAFDQGHIRYYLAPKIAVSSCLLRVGSAARASR
ncbi:proliferating cell nuclear antigen, partial [Rhodotorula sp. JG-1b]